MEFTSRTKLPEGGTGRLPTNLPSTFGDKLKPPTSCSRFLLPRALVPNGQLGEVATTTTTTTTTATTTCIQCIIITIIEHEPCSAHNSGMRLGEEFGVLEVDEREGWLNLHITRISSIHLSSTGRPDGSPVSVAKVRCQCDQSPLGRLFDWL